MRDLPIMSISNLIGLTQETASSVLDIIASRSLMTSEPPGISNKLVLYAWRNTAIPCVSLPLRKGALFGRNTILPLEQDPPCSLVTWGGEGGYCNLLGSQADLDSDSVLVSWDLGQVISPL